MVSRGYGGAKDGNQVGSGVPKGNMILQMVEIVYILTVSM